MEGGTYQDNCHCLADFAGAPELLLLLLKLKSCLHVPLGKGLEIDMRLGGEIMVVALADVHHGYPVVFVLFGSK